MPGCPANRDGFGEKYRFPISKHRVNAQLFLGLPNDSELWMLPWLNMSTGGQPKLRVDVIDQQ